MGKLRPFVQKESYMPNKKWIPFVIGNGYTTVDGASGPAPEWDTAIGNPVSFNALTPWPLRKLKVAFSPVQDLHGYDHPWPAGGGANKWDEDYDIGSINDNTGQNATGGNVRSKNYIPIKPSATYYFYVGNGAAVRLFFYGKDKTFLSRTDTGSATFTAPDDAYYCRFRTFNAYGADYNNDISINYPSSVTTYSPYSNECPISGWSSLTVEQRGKNLLNADAFQPGLASITIGDDIDAINASTRYIHSYIIPARNGIAFSIKSHDLTKINFYSVNRYVGRKLVDRAFLTLSDTDTHTNIYEANLYDYVRINIGAPSDVVADFENVDVQLELGTTVTPYEAGTGRSISISLGSTVYSGTVDVISGVVTVTHGFTTIDGNSTVNPNGATAITSRFITSISGKANGASNFTSNPFHYSASGDVVGIATGRANNNIIELMLPASVAQTANAGKAWFADNPTQVCYELAEPFTIQLTPQEVQSLAGDNVLFSDANGDLTVTYRSN